MNSKGQTFVEFLLVFIVLFAAAAGAFVMYKNAWKNRYINTSNTSAIIPSGAKGIVAKIADEAGGYSGYVK